MNKSKKIKAKLSISKTKGPWVLNSVEPVITYNTTVLPVLLLISGWTSGYMNVLPVISLPYLYCC